MRHALVCEKYSFISGTHVLVCKKVFWFQQVMSCIQESIVSLLVLMSWYSRRLIFVSGTYVLVCKKVFLFLQVVTWYSRKKDSTKHEEDARYEEWECRKASAMVRLLNIVILYLKIVLCFTACKAAWETNVYKWSSAGHYHCPSRNAMFEHGRVHTIVGLV